VGTAASVVGIGYLVIMALLTSFQGRLVYVPSTGGGPEPDAVGLSFETVWLDTDDGERLHGWYLPTSRPTDRTVLFFHGNAGHMSHRLDTLRLLASLQVNVFIIDYRGYGRSTGTPTEPGLERDAIAAWRYLTQTRGILPQSIGVHGRSLGAAVALGLTEAVKPGALIVESGFKSLPDMAAELYPWLPIRWLARIHYPNLKRIAKLTSPVLVAHSEHDRLIPFSHGEALFAAAKEPKRFLRMAGGHNGGFMATGDTYVQALRGHLFSNLASSK
jgi:uncharacterized protein